jgi:hypothetical protein
MTLGGEPCRAEDGLTMARQPPDSGPPACRYAPLAEEIAQHLVDGVGQFDFGQMAGAIEDFKPAPRQGFRQDRGVILNRINPVLASENQQHREGQFRRDLFGTVAIREPQLNAVHEATRMGGADDIAHQLA